jgi:hypothetical protein
MKIFLDDSRTPPDSSWVHCRTVDHALFLLTNPALERVDLVSLDHDLANETASDLVAHLTRQVKSGARFIPRLVIHYARPEDRARLQAEIEALQRLLKEVA